VFLKKYFSSFLYCKCSFRAVTYRKVKVAKSIAFRWKIVWGDVFSLSPVFSLRLFNSLLFWFWEKSLIWRRLELLRSPFTLSLSLLIYFLFLHYCARDSKPQSKWDKKEGGTHFTPPHSYTHTHTHTHTRTHPVAISFLG
jgi:hypothetical protein